MSDDWNKTHPAARRQRGLFGRFMSDRNGATAIEFAMLAIPFALLVFAILESCISFTAQQVVSNAADEVGRQFRTGQLRPDPNNKAALAVKVQNMICSRLEVMVAKGCPGLAIDLKQYASFADAAKVKIKLTADGDLDTTSFSIDPGQSRSKNMLRVFYKWPVVTDFMRASMSNIKGGKTLKFGVAVWQNEPFTD